MRLSGLSAALLIADGWQEMTRGTGQEGRAGGRWWWWLVGSLLGSLCGGGGCTAATGPAAAAQAQAGDHVVHRALQGDDHAVQEAPELRAHLGGVHVVVGVVEGGHGGHQQQQLQQQTQDTPVGAAAPGRPFPARGHGGGGALGDELRVGAALRADAALEEGLIQPVLAGLRRSAGRTPYGPPAGGADEHRKKNT